MFVAMGDPPFHLKDPSRIHSFVMPSPRVGGNGSVGVFSLHKSGVSSGHVASGLMDLVSSSNPLQGVGGKGGGGQVPFGTGLVLGPCGAVGAVSSALNGVVSDVETGVGGGVCVVHPLVIPGWVTPCGYALCGLGLCLCNLLAPGYIQECAHMMCPLWTLSMGLHIVCGAQQQHHGSCWVWSGVLTLLLLPFVIMVGSPLFVGFFLFVFALFSSVFFWRRLQGAQFILAWLCWAGLLFAFTLSLGVVVPPQMHLCVAAFFSISLGVLNSGGGKYLLRLG